MSDADDYLQLSIVMKISSFYDADDNDSKYITELWWKKKLDYAE